MRPDEEIRTLAYYLWQNAGEPSGTAERDWLHAQHVLQTGSVSAPEWSGRRHDQRVETAPDLNHAAGPVRGCS